MITEARLFEHETRGNHFTWCNKHTDGLIYSRIDRTICNREWFMKYSDCEVEIMQAHISDHFPIKLWRKMKRLQPLLRGLYRSVTYEIRQIQDYRLKLQQVQLELETDPFNIKLIQDAKIWTDKIIAATEEEEKILQERAKVDWIKLGDASNAYFHTIVRGRQK